MNAQNLKSERQQRGWTQKEAAQRLGVSQPYLSLLESAKRPLTPSLARRVHQVYGLPPTVLPAAGLPPREQLPDNQTLAGQLAGLGYPGFAYLRTRRPPKNPAEVLLLALAQDDLEPRLAEALPWLLLRYADTLDARWLVEQARLHNLQNRLGFVVNLARRVAEESPTLRDDRTQRLAALEDELRQSRLAREDTLCQASLHPAKRRWLEQNRPPEAASWNLLTDWRPEHLRYDSYAG